MTEQTDKFVSPVASPEGRVRELLVILGEEAAEVAHRVAKTLRFGTTEVQPGQPYDNAERIADEIGDLLGVMDRLSDLGVIDTARVEAAGAAKHAKLARYLQTRESKLDAAGSTETTTLDSHTLDGVKTQLVVPSDQVRVEKDAIASSDLTPPFTEDEAGSDQRAAKMNPVYEELRRIWAQIEGAEFEDINDDGDLVVLTISAPEARRIRDTLASEGDHERRFGPDAKEPEDE